MAPTFSKHQRAFAVRTYLTSRCRNPVKATLIAFAKEFNIDTKSMFKCSKNLLTNKRPIQRWVQSFKDRGSVENKNKKAIDRQSHSGRPNLRSPEKINAVRDSVVENPKRSVRRRSLELQIPRESLRKILKENLALNLYKIQINQQLTADNA